MSSHDNARAALSTLLRKSPCDKEMQVWPMDMSKEYTSHLLNCTKDINIIQFESILSDLGILGIDSGQITMKNRKIVLMILLMILLMVLLMVLLMIIKMLWLLLLVNYCLTSVPTLPTKARLLPEVLLIQMPCRCLNCRIHDLDTGFKCRTRSNERILKSVLLFRIIQIEWYDSSIAHSMLFFAAFTYDILCGSRVVLPTVLILSLTVLLEISLPTGSHYPLHDRLERKMWKKRARMLLLQRSEQERYSLKSSLGFWPDSVRIEGEESCLSR